MLCERYHEELGVDLCFQGFQAEMDALPGCYAEPWGRLLVVFLGDRPVGIGALRPLPSPSETGHRVAEIKRMYIEPDCRGKGLGREIAVRLIEEARTIGYKAVRLDTLARLKPAVALYRDLGFQEIPAYNPNPEDDILYFELSLA